MQARECGSGAAAGEEGADKHFLRTETTQAQRESSLCMHAGEIGEGGGGEHGIVLARCCRHELEDDCHGSGPGADRERDEDASMAPMEVMTIVQSC